MSLFGGTISPAQKISLAQYKQDYEEAKAARAALYDKQLSNAGIAMSSGDVDKLSEEYESFDSNATMLNTGMGAIGGFALGGLAQNWLGPDSKIGKWAPLIGLGVGALLGDPLLGKSAGARQEDFANAGFESSGIFGDMFEGGLFSSKA